MSLDFETLTVAELRALSVASLTAMTDEESIIVAGNYYVPPGAVANWRDAHDSLSLLMRRAAGLDPVAEAPSNKTPTPIAFMAELDLYDDAGLALCRGAME